MICLFWQDPDFVERTVLSDVISRRGFPGSRLALWGLGGIGKSQIAIEYGYRVRNRSPQTWVFWVRAGSIARFEEDYRKIAKALHIPGSDEKNADLLRMVHDWLCKESNGHWLMIIDNADDMDVFTGPPPNHKSTSTSAERAAPKVLDFLPHSPKGAMLITTRNRNVGFHLTGNYKHILRVEPMTETEAITLLKSKLDGTRSEDDMKTLVQALDCIPLAISQAAAYISNKTPRVTIAPYLKQLKGGDKDSAKLLQEDIPEARRDKERSSSIVATWQISFQYVRSTKPSASRLLSLMSLFDRQGIPESLLAGQYGQEKTVQQQEAKLKQIQCDFDDDWTTLTDFSFIKTNIDGHHFEMHRLVQFTMKKWLELHGELQPWTNKYITLLNSHYPEPDDDIGSCELLFAHAVSAILYRPNSTGSLCDWGSLMHKLGMYTNRRAVYDISEIFYRAATHAYETALVADSPQTLRTLISRANALDYLGREDEADKLRRKALEAHERTLGPSHPDTLRIMDTLAHTLHNQKRYAESSAILQRALEICERTYGATHHETISALESRALYLRWSGQLFEAEAMYRRAYEARQQGGRRPEHDETWCTNLTMIALNFELDGQMEEAEVLFREAVEVEQSLPGADDVTTKGSVRRLARVLGEQGKAEEAAHYYREALGGYSKQFGEEGEVTLLLMMELSAILSKLDKLEEAEILCR
ncbi:TPR-like protein [Trematosphaeria pertusa]|uniref:TPR-like protein n=1 Tax=Trematosphaeria pertusa TaxID=390896 RepID=A0A6A6I2G4_9PLEO|nr:TPR-like protein [Trematosphaeria pertusa]KAF2244063.1 TPR-like protein [Trematosphaeria pertusa]